MQFDQRIIERGWSQKKIANFLRLSPKKVNHWPLNEIKTFQSRKSKLKDIYVQRIIRWAKNKPTSFMSCSETTVECSTQLYLIQLSMLV